jgi:hypothetical protein
MILMIKLAKINCVATYYDNFDLCHHKIQALS